MKLNRKSVMVGAAALGLAGLLAGGAGIAAAAASTATGRASSPSFTSSTAPDGDGDMSEMMGGLSGMGAGMRGMRFGQGSPVAAAANYLGLSPADLQKQLRADKSLADIAKSQGRSVSGLEDAMVAAVRKNIDASTTLTAAEKVSVLAQVKSHIDTMVNTTHEAGNGFGRMGGGMMGGGMMGGVGH